MIVYFNGGLFFSLSVSRERFSVTFNRSSAFCTRRNICKVLSPNTVYSLFRGPNGIPDERETKIAKEPNEITERRIVLSTPWAIPPIVVVWYRYPDSMIREEDSFIQVCFHPLSGFARCQIKPWSSLVSLNYTKLTAPLTLRVSRLQSSGAGGSWHDPRGTWIPNIGLVATLLKESEEISRVSVGKISLHSCMKPGWGDLQRLISAVGFRLG